MSRLRPELRWTTERATATNGTAYFMILNAVETEAGLIHGRLEDRGGYCAIGSFFHRNREAVLPMDLIDEVAAVNDSMPTFTPKKRRARMLQWLRWRLKASGFALAGRPTKEVRAARSTIIDVQPEQKRLPAAEIHA